MIRKKQFCLNDGWAWCRLPNICREKITDGTHNSPPNEKKGDFLYITAKNIKFSGVDLTDVSYVSKEIHDVIYNRCSPVKNDVLLTKDGTIGEATVNNLDYPFSLLSSVALIKTANSILPWYIVYVLKSDYLQKKMIKEAKGTALKRIILDQINSFLVPLSPLNEQKEIVSQVKKNLTLIDSIDNDKSDLQTAIKQAKSRILDLAIHGKLVPQDSSDEPASVLLEKLRAEKEAKIKPGELKRDKNDSYIYKNTTDNCYYEKFNNGAINIDEEIPFDIPGNWQWCRLGTLGYWKSGSTPSKTKNEYYENGAINWLNTGDLNDGLITDIPKKITTLAQKDCNLQLFPIDSVCIAMYGATIGKIGILKTEATTNQACCVCSDFNGIYNKYLFFFLRQHKECFIQQSFGGAQPNISKEKITMTLIPLPPISEQKLIVSKIEEMFEQLNQIQCNLI